MSSSQAWPQTLSAWPVTLSAWPVTLSAWPVCQPQNDGWTAACGGSKRVPLSGQIPSGVDPTTLPGYAPAHLQAAYGVTAASAAQGAGETVAIVTAFVDAYLENDLNVYRSEFGLPPCTVASGCLTIAVPRGNRKMPDPAWGEETAIDTEMVSAICPLCKIAVVEAKSARLRDLAPAVAAAAALNPVAISNSYAIAESAKTDQYAASYSQPNIAVVAAAGDTPMSVNFPAVASTVVAVGGTSLVQNGDGTFAPQTVWSNTGGGCSAYIAKPAWQTDTGCPNRTANDIAAVADPATGVMAYATYGNGWNVYGGTSVSAPIVAGLFALANQSAGMHDASRLYDNAGLLFAPTGSNGVCSPSYLCTAGPGYNAPAGNGVPYGIGALL
jgi:subtilase family serine protease